MLLFSVCCFQLKVVPDVKQFIMQGTNQVALTVEGSTDKFVFFFILGSDKCYHRSCGLQII
jgi:hypothetical protein